jgi:hypothetical protein
MYALEGVKPGFSWGYELSGCFELICKEKRL